MIAQREGQTDRQSAKDKAKEASEAYKQALVNEALDNVETLLTSNEVTRFDAILFGSMHLRLARGESICFPQLEWVATPPEIRKLVTTRLKLTGYKYFPSTMSGVLREEKPLVPLQRER